MNFNIKEEYLTWRAEWRTRYLALSRRIRTLKLEHKVAQRAGLFTTGDWYNLVVLKNEANEALEKRRESKSAAERQYLKSADYERKVA